MQDRVILHCDCNSFFASVETVFNPSYKDVPMAVCGSVEDRHGIVLAKNELAKSYGIQTAETVISAKRKCPALVIAEPHHDRYLEFSKRVNAIYADYTDMIEPFGIDESWLDVTASRRAFGNGFEIAEQIRRRVREEIGITVSIGVSFNKVFAKLGSDYKKPDAITVIDKSNYEEIVYPLSVDSLLFVGKRTAETLRSLGIRTIGELAEAPEALLKTRFGKAGEMLYKYSRGLDDSPVCANNEDDTKSVGNGFTFKHDLVSREDVKNGIEYLSESIARRLRAKGLRCTTVSLSIKDEMLHVIQRQRPQNPPTDISREIADTAYRIFCEEWTVGKPIRTITVTASGLTKSEYCSEQIDMFGGEISANRERERRREETVDSIREKHGSSAIIKGSLIGNDIGVTSGKKRR